jgi:hypothetical protein
MKEAVTVYSRLCVCVCVCPSPSYPVPCMVGRLDVCFHQVGVGVGAPSPFLWPKALLPCFSESGCGVVAGRPSAIRHRGVERGRRQRQLCVASLACPCPSLPLCPSGPCLPQQLPGLNLQQDSLSSPQ